MTNRQQYSNQSYYNPRYRNFYYNTDYQPLA